MSMQPTLRVAESPEEFTARVAAGVRSWMAKNQYRQRHLAEALGVSQQAVSPKWRGVIPFTLVDLARIAGWLGISVAELMGDAAAVPPQPGPGSSGRSSARQHPRNTFGLRLLKRDTFRPPAPSTPSPRAQPVAA